MKFDEWKFPQSACHHFHWLNLPKPVPVTCWFADGGRQRKEGEGCTLMSLHAVLKRLHSNFVFSHLFSFIHRLFISTFRKQNLKKTPWNLVNMLPRGSLSILVTRGLCFSPTHNVYSDWFSFCVWIHVFICKHLTCTLATVHVAKLKLIEIATQQNLNFTHGIA